jgi:hypothetical protein
LNSHTYQITPNKLWLTLFGLWLMLLTGILASFVGSPGIVQAIRLKNLLEIKNEQLSRAQEELKKLQADSALLEHNRYAQAREIRKVLGYAAHDELIFDFSSGDQFK